MLVGVLVLRGVDDFVPPPRDADGDDESIVDATLAPGLLDAAEADT